MWLDGGRKTDGARPKVEAQQNDRWMRGEERGTRWKGERWKRLQRKEKEMLDCLRLLCLAQWPSGERDDGHMNQLLSIWNMAQKKGLSIVSCKSCTLPRERETHKERQSGKKRRWNTQTTQMTKHNRSKHIITNRWWMRRKREEEKDGNEKRKKVRTGKGGQRKEQRAEREGVFGNTELTSVLYSVMESNKNWWDGKEKDAQVLSYNCYFAFHLHVSFCKHRTSSSSISISILQQ